MTNTPTGSGALEAAYRAADEVELTCVSRMMARGLVGKTGIREIVNAAIAAYLATHPTKGQDEGEKT